MYVDQGTSKNTKKEHPLQLISSGLHLSRGFDEWEDTRPRSPAFKYRRL